jgi:transcriptional regulator with XRE-family HTH domain
MEVGQEIRLRREAKGWSQAKLAGEAGMGVSGVSQIETGARNPSAVTLRKLADALGVDVAEFFPKAPASPSTEPSPAEEERRARERAAILAMKSATRDTEEVDKRARDGAEDFPLGAIVEISNWREALRLFFEEAAAVREPSRELAEAWQRLDEAYKTMRLAADRDAFPKTELDHASSRANSRRWKEAQRERNASEGTPDVSAEDAG